MLPPLLSLQLCSLLFGTCLRARPSKGKEKKKEKEGKGREGRGREGKRRGEGKERERGRKDGWIKELRDFSDTFLHGPLSLVLCQEMVSLKIFIL